MGGKCLPLIGCRQVVCRQEVVHQNTACPRLDLMGNSGALWFCLGKPLYNVTCGPFLETPERSWPEPIFLASI